MLTNTKYAERQRVALSNPFRADQSTASNRWMSRSIGRRTASRKVRRRSKTRSRYAPTGLTRSATTITKRPSLNNSCAHVTFVSANTRTTGERTTSVSRVVASAKGLCYYGFQCLSPFRRFLLENRNQSQWRYKECKDKHPEQEVIHRSILKLEITSTVKTS